MNIVILDGYTLNPGDLSWSGLEALGRCTIYDRTPADLTAERAQGAEVVLTNKVALREAELAQLPQLKYIGVLATGYDVVDVAAAGRRGVVVTNIPTYGTRSVAQMTFALLLELTQHVGHHAATVRQGRWSAGSDFCYWDHPLIELDGLSMGIIGFGRIGRAVAAIAPAFGMRVLAHDTGAAAEPMTDVRMVDLPRLLKSSDVVSLHCPLTPQNKGMINAANLAMMKPGAFLINTARGPLVNEPDLAAALNEGRIAGAALDVLVVEPPPPDNPLLTAKNCIITPHIAWATLAARQRLLDIAIDNLRAYLEGRPSNAVTG